MQPVYGFMNSFISFACTVCSDALFVCIFFQSTNQLSANFTPQPFLKLSLVMLITVLIAHTMLKQILTLTYTLT